MLDRRRHRADHSPELHDRHLAQDKTHAAHDAGAALAAEGQRRRDPFAGRPGDRERQDASRPPVPRPAVHGPLTTKIVQSMILPICDITDVSREWRMAVWP